MRFGDTKIVMIDFYSFDIDYLEMYLERMAIKGWILEKITNIYIKFKRIEPKEVKYTIDIVDKITSYADKDNEVALEYRENLRELGWEFTCSYNNLQVFYKEYTSNKNYISKKGREEKRLLIKNSFNELIFKLLLIGIYIFGEYISIFRDEQLIYLASNENIIKISVISVALMFILIDLFRLLKFRFKYEVKIKRRDIYFMRLKGISIFIGFLMVLIYLNCLLFTDNKEVFNKIFIVISFLLSIILFGYLLNNKRYTFIKKFKLLSYYILAIAIIFIINNFIVSNIFNNKINREYLLTLKDFNDEVISEDDIYVDEESSFIANKVFYIANGKKMKLSYELFESDYEFMITWNFNKMMSWFNKQGIVYNEIDSFLPQEIKVYTDENEKNYIMLSSNKIIEVIGLDDSNNKEEALKVIYNKIFTDKKEEVI